MPTDPTPRHASLARFLAEDRASLAKGPVALIFVEDAVEVESTLRHARDIGFRKTLVLVHPDVTLPDTLPEGAIRIDHDTLADGAVVGAVNAVIAAAPGIWLHYGFNAEYLFYPFCEHRSVGELTIYAAEERRDAILSFVIDLYAADLAASPDAVSITDAHLDRSGYFALARPDRANHNYPKERQLDFFGGLRWRFEEHIPPARRRIDRVALFRAKPGLVLRPDHSFSDEEYNTYACPWHNSLTAAVASFRTAKALRRNPGSRGAIGSFHWRNSAPFTWHSQQLLDLGLMEPGQWF